MRLALVVRLRGLSIWQVQFGAATCTWTVDFVRQSYTLPHVKSSHIHLDSGRSSNRLLPMRRQPSAGSARLWSGTLSLLTYLKAAQTNIVTMNSHGKHSSANPSRRSQSERWKDEQEHQVHKEHSHCTPIQPVQDATITYKALLKARR